MNDLQQLPIPRFLIEDWLLENTIAMLVGDTGSFKSTLAIGIAVCIQNSLPWHSLRTRACNVAIFNHEDGSGFKTRYLANVDHYEINEPALFWDSEVPNLLNTAEVDARISAMKDAGIGLVVIDTLAHAIPGADENSAKDMGVAISNLIRIKQHLNATVLVVHHTGKDASKGARGSSSLKAAVDTEISVTASRGGVKLNQRKQRHCRIGAPLHLIPQEMPIDGASACILVSDPEAGTVVGGHHLKGKTAIGWSLLNGLALENGNVPVKSFVLELRANDSFTAGQKETGSFDKAISRLFNELTKRKLITHSGDHLTLTERSI
jgi:hypothetical protein